MEMLATRLVSWVMWSQHGGTQEKLEFLIFFKCSVPFFMHKTFKILKSASLKINISLYYCIAHINH